MRLAEILDVERVVVRLRAPNKASALASLAELFVGSVEGIDAAGIAAVFEEREAIASTGIGSGVAIPHGRMESVPRLLAAVAICEEGVDFDAIDGKPAHILVALLGPRNLEHLKALARFSRLLRSPRVRARLVDAADAESAYQTILDND